MCLLFGTNVVDQPESRSDSPAPVEAEELNAWKRGLTPQAEIWNGRLAMIGLSAGIAVVLLVRVFSGG
nr:MULTISPECIES: high light inducible protein [unclassified Synechococcus]